MIELVIDRFLEHLLGTIMNEYIERIIGLLPIGDNLVIKFL